MGHVIGLVTGQIRESSKIISRKKTIRQSGRAKMQTERADDLMGVRAPQ
jgi:hypothetical protein